ncbi:hypothetical protein ACLBWZ_03370 [Brucellaceae bacterium C25G]
MAGRVWFQRGSNGLSFKFRVSKPGKSVDSNDKSDFILHEDIGVVAPYVAGSVAVPARSNVLINFDRVYPEPALIMIKPSDGLVAILSQFEAKIQSNMSSMRLYNYTATARQITYYVYWNSIG